MSVLVFGLLGWVMCLSFGLFLSGWVWACLCLIFVSVFVCFFWGPKSVPFGVFLGLGLGLGVWLVGCVEGSF